MKNVLELQPVWEEKLKGLKVIGKISVHQWDSEEDKERRAPSSHLKSQTLGCHVLP